MYYYGMIEFNNVDKSFNEEKILDDFSFNVNKGESVCLNARSGKGKSLILKIIQGFVLVDAGEVIVANELLTEETLNRIRLKMFVVPQNINLSIDNAEELVGLLNLPPINVDSIVDNLKTLGLQERDYTKKFSKLSGGQIQKIIIAVCLSIKKEILIMDEPTSSLDEESIADLIKLMEIVRRQNPNLTIISSSHNNTWMNSCDRIIRI